MNMMSVQAMRDRVMIKSPYENPGPLKPVKKDEKSCKCGPTVLCSITGKPASKVKEAIRKGRLAHGYDNRRVSGTHWWELEAGLRQLGFTGYLLERPREKITVARWLRERDAEKMKMTFIIHIGNHWIAVRGRKFVDTMSEQPVFIRQAPKGRKAYVKAVYRVMKKKKDS